MDDFYKPARYKGAWGGRGSGKSHGFADMTVEVHVADPNTKTVCVREIQKSLKMSSKALIESKIQTLGVGHLFEVQNDCIKRKDGDGIIIFQGLQDHTADSIKSLEGFDRAWCEEAQSLSHASLKKLRPTIRKPGSELWFTWNPENETDPVDDLLRGENLPEDAIVKRVNYIDNPWFPDVLEQERLFDLKRDPDLYQHVWEGEYLVISKATVFKNWEVREFDAPDDANFKFGLDFGESVDPTVLVRCYQIGRRLFIDYEAYATELPLIDTPELLYTIPESDRWPIVADSSRPGMINHLRDHGFPKIMGAVKGKDSVVEGVEFLRGLDIVVHPRCVNTINELKRYRYKVDPKTDQILPIFEDKFNHVIDSLRYAMEATRRTSKVQEPEEIVDVGIASHW